MEPQKILSSQSNLEKEESWKYYMPWLQTTLQSYSSQKYFVTVAVQLLSDVQLYGSSMNCSISGCSVLHYLLEFAQTHDHWVSGAI